MTNLDSLTDADLGLVNGGTNFEVHFKLFGYFFGITGTDTPNGQMTCTTIVGPGHKGSSSSCTIPV